MVERRTRASSLRPERTNGEVHSRSYYRARYYDPLTGRFLREDPLHFRTGPNFYPFVNNNPVNLRDPMGRHTLQVGLTLSGTLPLGAFGITYSVSAGIAVDTTGGIAFYRSNTPLYLPGVAEGAGGFGGITVAVSDAHTVCGLGGPFYNVSASAGDVVAGTVDYFTGKGDGPNGYVDGGGVTFGLGGGGSASTMVTTTSLHPLNRCSCQQ
jgi:RHS repeat-associated protein